MIDLAINVAAFLFLAFVGLLALIFVGWVIVSIVAAAQDEHGRFRVPVQPKPEEQLPLWPMFALAIGLGLIVALGSL